MALCNSNRIIDFGLRGALFGASLGGVVGLTKGFFGERSKHSLDKTLQRLLRDYESIRLDGELFTSMVELGKYRKFHLDSYKAVAAGINRMVAIHVQLLSGQLQPRPSIPRLLSLATSKAVEGIRTLRAAFDHACPGRPSELESFDEIAGAVQKSCNDYQHNVSMHIQCEL